MNSDFFRIISALYWCGHYQADSASSESTWHECLQNGLMAMNIMWIKGFHISVAFTLARSEQRCVSQHALHNHHNTNWEKILHNTLLEHCMLAFPLIWQRFVCHIVFMWLKQPKMTPNYVLRIKESDSLATVFSSAASFYWCLQISLCRTTSETISVCPDKNIELLYKLDWEDAKIWFRQFASCWTWGLSFFTKLNKITSNNKHILDYIWYDFIFGSTYHHNVLD